MAGNFAASVKGWSNKAKRNTTLVQRRAVDLLARDLLAAGRSGGARGPGVLPIDTGNLRNSLMASTAVINATRRDDFAAPDSEIALAIAGWNPEKGEALYLGWQAAYARRINYGFTGTDSLGRNYNQAGYFFREVYASRWQDYVKRAAAEFQD